MPSKNLEYMTLAMDLALKAKGQTSPNPLVGAVIVKNNKIISTGFHRRCGSDHAEIVALKKAGLKARGAILYVTLEPCSHYGRTPPCVDAIVRSGIKEVFVGMKDPNPVNHGRSIVRLRKSGIKTHIGLLEKELKKINEPFSKYIRLGMPLVVAKIAQTLDGKIATSAGQSKWITSESARSYAHHLRNGFDAILVGINTVLKDDPFLNATSKDKRLKKIILDSTLKIRPDCNLFRRTKLDDVIIATTSKANKNKLHLFQKKGINVFICPPTFKSISLKWLLRKLADLEISSVLIEGGATVIGRALKEKVVDKALIFIAPKIMGDQNAMSSVVGFNSKDVNHLLKLHNIHCQRMGEDILIEGYLN